MEKTRKIWPKVESIRENILKPINQIAHDEDSKDLAKGAAGKDLKKIPAKMGHGEEAIAIDLAT